MSHEDGPEELEVVLRLAVADEEGLPPHPCPGAGGILTDRGALEMRKSSSSGSYRNSTSKSPTRPQGGGILSERGVLEMRKFDRDTEIQHQRLQHARKAGESCPIGRAACLPACRPAVRPRWL